MALRLPTLVLHTREDPVIPIENGRELGARIPARYVELPGRDHASPFENRERLIAEVRAVPARPEPMWHKRQCLAAPPAAP